VKKYLDSKGRRRFTESVTSKNTVIKVQYRQPSCLGKHGKIRGHSLEGGKGQVSGCVGKSRSFPEALIWELKFPGNQGRAKEEKYKRQFQGMRDIEEKKKTE